MQTSHLPLIEFIRAEIKTRGPQSLAWFMEQALYHPQHGYYSSGRAALGRHGDYFTNVSVGPLFGRLLAAQFAEMWERLGQIDNFVIVEQGAHHGEFARDLLEAVRERSPEFFEALRYRVVEPFPVLEDRQSETVAEFRDKVSWQKSLDHVEPFSGIHVSNELLDSMPVHLIVSECGRGLRAPIDCAWREKFVTLNGDDFAFVDQPVVDPKLQVRVEGLPARPSGYQTEINLAALDWIHNVAAKISRGYVLAIDYGFPRDEFYAPHRSAGTLQVRSQHQNLNSPFEQIGRADITAHVDWTSVAEHAESFGLRVRGFTDQHHFITGIVSESLRGEIEKDVDPKSKRALQTLLHPEMLGRAFQVLALGKDIDLAAPLAGFKFARDARATLGI